MPDELECDQPTFECEGSGHQETRIFEQSVPQPTTAAGSGGSYFDPNQITDEPRFLLLSRQGRRLMSYDEYSLRL
jgi:hypothetical protein